MTEKQRTILAFESSADETSVAVIQNGHTILSNVVATQIASHQRFGGIVPEVASRHHIEWITRVLDDALTEAQITNPKEQLDAVAATYGPGLVGSLLVGLMAAKSTALAYDLPFIGVNHLAGHLAASRFVDDEINYPALALMVSGGHTELVWLAGPNQFEVIGSTLDDAAGEAFDKIGRVLEVPYPAGKAMEELAAQGQPTIDFPLAKTQATYDFSFSGLKSAVINYLHHAEQKELSVNRNDVAASFQSAVVEALIEKTELAVQKFEPKTLIVGGGVAANTSLRTQLEALTQRYQLAYVPVPIKLAGDNAAMIGAAADWLYQEGEFSSLDLNTNPGLDFKHCE